MVLYLEQLADIAGAEDLVHVGELVRLPGREVGREDAAGRAPAPQQLARRARRRRGRSACACACAAPRLPSSGAGSGSGHRHHHHRVPHRRSISRQASGSVGVVGRPELRAESRDATGGV